MTKRTTKQNGCMHKYRKDLADALNDAGMSVPVVMKMIPTMNPDWTPTAIRERIWLPFQETKYNVQTSADLDTVQIQRVYLNINRWTSEQFGINVDWPSVDSLKNRSEHERV